MKTNYIVLKDSEDRFYFVSPEQIERNEPLHDTYDQGRKVTAEEAGDYSIRNIESCCGEDLRAAGVERFGESFQNLSWDWDYEGAFQIENLEGTGLEDKEEEILNFISSWCKENESYVMCDSYTYWNGHNYKSIVLKQDEGNIYPEYEELEEEEARPILQAFEKVTFWANAGFGLKAAYYGGYKFIDSCCEGHIGSYEAVVMDSDERLSMAEEESGASRIETTSGQALPVESIEQAKELAEKYGLRVCTYKKRTGAREWSCIDTNTTSLMEVSAADYGDEYELFGPDDTDDYFEYKVRPAAEGVQNIDGLEKLAKEAREVVDAICTLGENEKVVVMGTTLVDTVETATVRKEVDATSYMIGVESNE